MSRMCRSLQSLGLRGSGEAFEPAVQSHPGVGSWYQGHFVIGRLTRAPSNQTKTYTRDYGKGRERFLLRCFCEMPPKSHAKDTPGTLGFESLGKKGEGVEFKRKKLKSSVGYGGLRRSSRLLGSGATSHSAAGPTAHTAAWVLGCPDILHQVFAMLDSATLARCAAVCRQWMSEAHAATLWRPLCEVHHVAFRCTPRGNPGEIVAF